MKIYFCLLQKTLTATCQSSTWDNICIANSSYYSSGSIDISTSFILLTCSACLCFTLFPSIYHWLSVVYYKIPGFDLYMILSISNCLFLRFMFLGVFFILFIPFLFSEHFTFSLRLLMRVMLETTHIEILFFFFVYL